MVRIVSSPGNKAQMTSSRNQMRRYCRRTHDQSQGLRIDHRVIVGRQDHGGDTNLRNELQRARFLIVLAGTRESSQWRREDLVEFLNRPWGPAKGDPGRLGVGCLPADNMLTDGDTAHSAAIREGDNQQTPIRAGVEPSREPRPPFSARDSPPWKSPRGPGENPGRTQSATTMRLECHPNGHSDRRAGPESSRPRRCADRGERSVRPGRSTARRSAACRDWHGFPRAHAPAKQRGRPPASAEGDRRAVPARLHLAGEPGAAVPSPGETAAGPRPPPGSDDVLPAKTRGMKRGPKENGSWRWSAKTGSASDGSGVVFCASLAGDRQSRRNSFRRWRARSGDVSTIDREKPRAELNKYQLSCSPLRPLRDIDAAKPESRHTNGNVDLFDTQDQRRDFKGHKAV